MIHDVIDRKRLSWSLIFQLKLAQLIEALKISDSLWSHVEVVNLLTDKSNTSKFENTQLDDQQITSFQSHKLFCFSAPSLCVGVFSKDYFTAKPLIN